METLDRGKWPLTDPGIRVARASLFVAQALDPGMIVDGREQEIREIRDYITTIVRDPAA